jgi:F-type H+-transporting ATPase subunit gamma
MSRRHSLEHQRRGLTEIRGIMNAMKTLAYMETRKLARFIEAQRAVVEGIETAASDLLAFHPDILPQAPEHHPLYLLIGSERGFCGDFNHRLESALHPHTATTSQLIAVGRKLHQTLAADITREATLIEGASVVEEIAPLLDRILATLGNLQRHAGTDSLWCLYHEREDEVIIRRLLPPFQDQAKALVRFSHPPLLNQSPAACLASLGEHYLFSALHEVLYSSLMAENHHRVAHLEGAVRHLDSEVTKLAHRCNTLRQEEVIEEIEVILLSAVDISERQENRNRSAN